MRGVRVMTQFSISGGGGSGISAADATASGSGVFWGYTVYPPATADLTATGAEGTANQVYAWKFVLPFRITVRSISAKMSAATAGTFDAGIYDFSGNKPLNTGGLTTNSTAVQVANITPVTLQAGVYYFAFCGSVSNLNYFGVTNNSRAQFDNYYNCGTAASAGVLPATLGTLTSQNGTNTYPVCALFLS